MIGYILALLPLYVLVYLPLTQWFNSPTNRSSRHHITNFNSTFIADDEPLFCHPHSYNTFMLSHEPLIIYIEGFLSNNESEHLLKIRYESSSMLLIFDIQHSSVPALPHKPNT